MSEVTEMIARAKQIKEAYTAANQKAGKEVWQTKDYAAGLVGDVGDFMKLIMAKANLRDVDDLDSKLSHEAGDILWSLLVICDDLGINISDSFHKTMDELEARMA